MAPIKHTVIILHVPTDLMLYKTSSGRLAGLAVDDR